MINQSGQSTNKLVDELHRQSSLPFGQSFQRKPYEQTWLLPEQFYNFQKKTMSSTHIATQA